MNTCRQTARRRKRDGIEAPSRATPVSRAVSVQERKRIRAAGCVDPGRYAASGPWGQQGRNARKGSGKTAVHSSVRTGRTRQPWGRPAGNSWTPSRSTRSARRVPESTRFPTTSRDTGPEVRIRLRRPCPVSISTPPRQDDILLTILLTIPVPRLWTYL